MKNILLTLFLLFILPLTSISAKECREILVSIYIDKMKAGWLGQMAGVGWGSPTEFKCKGEIMPANMKPPWKPEMINQFEQDDVYVEMTFLRTLETYGLNVSIRQAGDGVKVWLNGELVHENWSIRGVTEDDDRVPVHFKKGTNQLVLKIQNTYVGWGFCCRMLGQ